MHSSFIILCEVVVQIMKSVSLSITDSTHRSITAIIVIIVYDIDSSCDRRSVSLVYSNVATIYCACSSFIRLCEVVVQI